MGVINYRARKMLSLLWIDSVDFIRLQSLLLSSNLRSIFNFLNYKTAQQFLLMFTNFQIPTKKLGQARKKFKTNPQSIREKNISEFDTELPPENEPSTVKKPSDKPNEQFTIPIEEQRKRNHNILGQLLQKPPAPSLQPSSTPSPKTQPGTNSSSKPKPSPSQNWKAFLLSTPKSSKSPQPKPRSEYVALDCEFVECVDGEQVARISIVGENGEELFDSYIRPESRIIDYRTEFSGVTFGHLRKAPTWAAVLRDVHKVLYNRVLVGHTLYKDLEVMRMTGWKGIKSMVDVSRYSQYKEGGKVQALKKLTAVFLGRDIQIGKHSSLQDAKATMELFILRKDKILAEIERKDKFLQKKEAHQAKLNKREQQK